MINHTELVNRAERWLRNSKRCGEVFININTPHRVLASMVGLTRETVTLQILKFQKEGLLYNNKRKMVIKKIEKLKEIAKI
jgi:CRP-like cAMP-binding protein